MGGSIIGSAVIVGLFVGALNANVGNLKDRVDRASNDTQALTSSINMLTSTVSKLGEQVDGTVHLIQQERQDRIDGERRLLQFEKK